MKKIISISILCFLFLFFPALLHAQNIQSELGFNIGVALPSDEMEAMPGLDYQLDYRLLNHNFGLQFSMNYLQNPLDKDYLLNISGASSISSDNWTSVSGMLKLLGRINTLGQKLLFDISFGFGVMQSRFPSQIYSYTQTSENNLIKVSPVNDFSSAFVLGAGLRIHYKFNEKSSVGVSYDLQSLNQHYTLTGIQSNATSIETNNDIKLNYSNILLGVNYFF